MSAGSLPSGLTRGYAKSFKDMLVESITKVLTIQDLKALDDADLVEAAVNERGSVSNPKWDRPIFGYQTFSEAQKACLREQARIELGHGTP